MSSTRLCLLFVLSFSRFAYGVTPFVASFYSPDENMESFVLSQPGGDITGTEKTLTIPAGKAVLMWTVTTRVETELSQGNGRIIPVIGDQSPTSGMFINSTVAPVRATPELGQLQPSGEKCPFGCEWKRCRASLYLEVPLSQFPGHLSCIQRRQHVSPPSARLASASCWRHSLLREAGFCRGGKALHVQHRGHRNGKGVRRFPGGSGFGGDFRDGG